MGPEFAGFWAGMIGNPALFLIETVRLALKNEVVGKRATSPQQRTLPVAHAGYACMVQGAEAPDLSRGFAISFRALMA